MRLLEKRKKKQRNKSQALATIRNRIHKGDLIACLLPLTSQRHDAELMHQLGTVSGCDDTLEIL